jgi:hypothetical protein
MRRLVLVPIAPSPVLLAPLLVIVFLGLAACGGSQAQRIPVDPPAPLAGPAPVQPVEARLPEATPRPTLDEAATIAQSHAWWDALDKRETARVLAALGPTFVLFEDGRFADGPILQQSLDNRREKNMPIKARTWSDERVYSAPGTSIYIGLAKEQLPDKPAIEGWTTLAWVHDGAKWTLAYAHWDRAGLAAERERWNEYFAQGIGFNKEPNKTLVEAVKGVKKPGTALDIAMGQGRNAVFLATQGWKTTGVDISDEGIRQAKAAAAEKKVKLDALLVDVDNWDLGKNKWDLITLIYAGNDPKGGMFVAEYFHADSSAAHAGAGGFKTGELAAAFKDGFEILRDDVIEDNADWASGRKMMLVRFVARKK